MNENGLSKRIAIVAIVTSTLALVAIGALAGYYAHSQYSFQLDVADAKKSRMCKAQVEDFENEITRISEFLNNARILAGRGNYASALAIAQKTQNSINDISPPECSIVAVETFLFFKRAISTNLNLIEASSDGRDADAIDMLLETETLTNLANEALSQMRREQ